MKKIVVLISNLFQEEKSQLFFVNKSDSNAPLSFSFLTGVFRFYF